MLPGVSTRALVVKEPMPPTIVPYTGPPLASAPWQATHLAAYTCRPSATEPLPGVIRSICAQPHVASAAAAIAPTNLNLADGIAHLPVRVDRPRLDRVVVLHEADDRARLAQVGDARLH